jgi:hypothetical protein
MPQSGEEQIRKSKKCFGFLKSSKKPKLKNLKNQSVLIFRSSRDDKSKGFQHIILHTKHMTGC